MTDPALIITAIELSELSARQFAERILSRDERTVRRWSAGDIAIPAVARIWLMAWIELSAAKRKQLLAILAP